MSRHHRVVTTYRGKTYVGEWRVLDGQIHLSCEFGTISRPIYKLAGAGALRFQLPSEIAEDMLWKLIRDADPERPLVDWPREWARLRERPTEEGPRKRPFERATKRRSGELLSLLALALLAAYLLVAVAGRVNEGRCVAGARGLNCTYPPGENLPSP